MEEQENNKSLIEKMDDLAKRLDELEEKKKAKSFKHPWYKFEFLKPLLNPAIKKGKVIVQYIGQNGRMKILLLKVEDFTTVINDTYHSLTPDSILMWGKYPWVIIPSWSDKPFSPAENFEKIKSNGELTTGQQYILAKMKKDIIKGKTNIPFVPIIIGIGVLVALYFLLTKMGVKL